MTGFEPASSQCVGRWIRPAGRDPVAKMACPGCGHATVSTVLDTRGVRRRRACLDCGCTYSTIEVLARPGRGGRPRLSDVIPAPRTDPSRGGRAPVRKLPCLNCGDSTISRVLDTRGMRRRRQCLACGHTFPTLEIPSARRKLGRPRKSAPPVGGEINQATA